LFQFIHNLNSFSYAAQFTRSLEEKSKSTTEVGGHYKLNSATTIGGKLSHDAQLGLFALHQLNENTKLSHSFSLNVAQPSQPFLYGFALKFKF